MALGNQKQIRSSGRNTRQPAIRAVAILNLLNYLDHYSFGLQRDVQAQIPNEIENISDTASYRSWVTATDSQSVLKAIWSVLGPEQAVDTMACCIEKFLDSAYVKPLIPGEGSVTDTFCALEFVWDLIFRNTCNVGVEPMGESEVMIQLRNVNEEVFYSKEYLSVFASIFLGIMRPEEADCHVAITNVNCKTRCVDYHVSWKKQFEADA